MAFINEKLTVEQRKEFMKRGIKKPTSDNAAIPIYRTVDKERNMCLWEIGNLGRDDFEHQMFLFDWNEKEYYIIMKYSNPSVGNVVWSHSPYQKENLQDQDCINDFVKALMIYAVNGRPNQQGIVEVKVKMRGI